ncbi:MAG: aminotransferase class IV [Glaciecola sp.]
MSTVYLNGKFVPASEATISPMDRGFLFGDGIYEVIPCYDGKPVGLSLHMARMNRGLQEIALNYTAETDNWQQIIAQLIEQVPQASVGVYIHVSRGADTKRFHAYPDNISPTVFAYAFAIPASQPVNAEKAKTFEVITQTDLRWQRCHIKSTSLLGNVMHFQQGQVAGKDEVILLNEQNNVTEASACNVFVVKDNRIMTPALDHQLLPGITRQLLLDALQKQGGFDVSEQNISYETLMAADEVWITSSSKEVGPVVRVNDTSIGGGKPGPMWLAAQSAYNRFKFDT